MRELTTAEMERASRYGALAACALAGLLCAWLAVRTLWVALPRGDDLAAAPPMAAAAETALRATVSVSKWHLFGNAGPSVHDLARAAPATQLQLILRGTLAEAEPREGMAVIADPTAGERAYRVGDALPGGATLDAVYPDRVVLLHEGVQETLALPFDHPSPAIGSAPPQPGGNPGAPRLPAGVNPGAPAPATPPGSVGQITPMFVPPQMAQGAVDFSKVQQQLALDPAALARQVNAQPVLENGRMVGVRLSGGPGAAMVASLGLQPNDVVTAVNNVPIDSPARVQQVMSSVQSASRVTVTVLRDGKPVTLSVNVK
ncbi:type II secretion system protein GspC [Tahibacter soli]|uniref:Type II secretion system protein GspC n=1 Tax=Tahibacter soli TaxID=2983605 RepID=A0A9X3YK15_9GAMM|nr:type II secretion system protein GspC [Tahibacter soli]MDC8013702.1 type II secretion system protein GspC [Tahibacter soli]